MDRVRRPQRGRPTKLVGPGAPIGCWVPGTLGARINVAGFSTSERLSILLPAGLEDEKDSPGLTISRVETNGQSAIVLWHPDDPRVQYVYKGEEAFVNARLEKDLVDEVRAPYERGEYSTLKLRVIEILHRGLVRLGERDADTPAVANIPLELDLGLESPLAPTGT